MIELRDILLKNIKGSIVTRKSCDLDAKYYTEKDIELLQEDVELLQEKLLAKIYQSFGEAINHNDGTVQFYNDEITLYEKIENDINTIFKKVR